jgi:hypothetical protein
MNALTKLQTQNAVLSQQIVTIKVELENVAKENKILAQDKWTLGQEKAQLFGQLKQAASALRLLMTWMWFMHVTKMISLFYVKHDLNLIAADEN